MGNTRETSLITTELDGDGLVLELTRTRSYIDDPNSKIENRRSPIRDGSKIENRRFPSATVSLDSSFSCADGTKRKNCNQDFKPVDELHSIVRKEKN